MCQSRQVSRGASLFSSDMHVSPPSPRVIGSDQPPGVATPAKGSRSSRLVNSGDCFSLNWDGSVVPVCYITPPKQRYPPTSCNPVPWQAVPLCEKPHG